MIGPYNIFQKATAFWRVCMRGDVAVDLPNVLLAMIQSGKYYPASAFLNIRGSMNVTKANIMFRMCINPQATTEADIMSVFFVAEPVAEDYAFGAGRPAAQNAVTGAQRRLLSAMAAFGGGGAAGASGSGSAAAAAAAAAAETF
jgi:hypothetical protein